MTYGDITFNERNRIKRYLQNRRLDDAIGVLDRAGLEACRTILDFGAGDGQLCRRIQTRFSGKTTYCYEPSPQLAAEAEDVLRLVANAPIVTSLDALGGLHFDCIFCLGVLEHLPEERLGPTLELLSDLLVPDGVCVLEVPNEIFLPALVRGVFRMTRRYGEFDARLRNVLRASVGRPPRQRPLGEIGPGLPYHFHHLGFDDRRLTPRLREHFAIVNRFGSPWSFLGPRLNFEIYYLLRKAPAATDRRPQTTWAA
jgi:SAM-dependent methyltransferase